MADTEYEYSSTEYSVLDSYLIRRMKSSLSATILQVALARFRSRRQGSPQIKLQTTSTEYIRSISTEYGVLRKLIVLCTPPKRQQEQPGIVT
jgi:hypothetical protein